MKNWLWYVLPVPERNSQIGNAAHTSMWYGVVSFPKVCIYSNPQNRTHLQRINPKLCGIIILDSLDKSNIGLLLNPTSIWWGWSNPLWSDPGAPTNKPSCTEAQLRRRFWTWTMDTVAHVQKKDLPIKHGGYVRLHEAMGMAKYCHKLLIVI